MLNSTAELIIFNNQFLAIKDIKACQNTHAITVYEVVRLIDGVPLFWEGHWERLQNSLNAIQSKVKLDKAKFERSFLEFIKQNNCLNTNIRIEIFEENILVYIIRTEYPTKSNYKEGVNINFTEDIRVNPTRKILRRNWKKIMERKINNAGVFESLLINKEGLITEGSHTNVFFIKGNSIFSADEELILPGITRLEILKIASAENISLEYVSLRKENISNYDAAFLCATSYHILPIAHVDNQHYNINHPTLQILMNAFKVHLEREIKMTSLKWKI